ncbi:MAG: restriction endonuclease [Sulfurimonas sp.]|nr:restriction endonuclease [Sulfurimonas sp.]MDD3834962.1 restriction endonuclease [Sulfurimonas sp.]
MTLSFGNLSPSEFEILAADIVGAVEGVFFERFGEGTDGGIDGRVYKDNSSMWIIQAKRYKNSSSLLSQMTEEKPKMDKLKPQRYFLVTSSSLSPQMKDKLKDEMDPYILSTADIYGAEDITALLEESPNIYRKHYKLWLGSARELSFIQHNEFYNRSSTIIDRLAEDLKYFVSYDKLEIISDKLKISNYLLITGDPNKGCQAPK